MVIFPTPGSPSGFIVIAGIILFITPILALAIVTRRFLKHKMRIHFILQIVLLLVINFILIFNLLLLDGAYARKKYPNRYGKETGIWAATFKTPPAARVDTDSWEDAMALTIRLTTYAEYETVTVRLTIYNIEKEVIREEFITQERLSERTTYLIRYDLTEHLAIPEILDATSFACTVYAYE
ncbi:MAG: hypothetical protein IJY50_01915 [Clostridia bacterium]|nr:hypothetical protein [Clostridia bacterium]